MKIYADDFNGVIAPVIEELKDRDHVIVDEVRDADLLLLWQDVRGDNVQLCKMNRDVWKKPVVVVQHGRAASRDYCAPNSFPLYADKFCAWGEADAKRMSQVVEQAKIEITGSPLASMLVPRREHPGNICTFVPLVADHEEPENLIAFFQLKRLELMQYMHFLEDNNERLRKDFSLTKTDLESGLSVISKLTTLHEKDFYMGAQVISGQGQRDHMQQTLSLLSASDVVVAMEEGTFPLLAHAMAIPVVICDIYRWQELGGNEDYSKVEYIKTDAPHYVDNVDDLPAAVITALSDPEAKFDEARKVCNDEFCPEGQDPIANIVKVCEDLYADLKYD